LGSPESVRGNETDGPLKTGFHYRFGTSQLRVQPRRLMSDVAMWYGYFDMNVYISISISISISTSTSTRP